jgi:hypothetical protein
MDFQNRVDGLERRATEMKAAVNAATVETRHQLEQRLAVAEAETDQALNEAHLQAGAAADRTRTAWEQARADAKARVAEIKLKAAHRHDRIEADAAGVDAELAEGEAGMAIDLATWAIGNAQLAVLDALYMRARAQDKVERVKVGA